MFRSPSPPVGTNVRAAPASTSFRGSPPPPPTAAERFRGRIRAVRRFVARRRRVLAAAAAASAVAAALLVTRPPGPHTVPVLTAARDLDTGAVPGAADVRVVRFPAGLAPAHALRRGTDTRGRALAAAVGRGEPITDIRLVGPQLRGSPGGVALPVRFADAEAARLLRPGDRIDVLAGPPPEVSGPLPAAGRPATGADASPARVVARDATVLARPDSGPDRIGGLLVLDVPADTAAGLAGAAAHAPLTYVIHTATSGDTTAREASK